MVHYDYTLRKLPRLPVWFTIFVTFYEKESELNETNFIHCRQAAAFCVPYVRVVLDQPACHSYKEPQLFCVCDYLHSDLSGSEFSGVC